MGCGPRHACRFLERGKVQRFAGQGAKDENSFVNDADAAYNVH